MFKNYLKIAWRNLAKNKGYSVINIGGLALGIAVTLIIGLWVQSELTYDSYFKNKDKIAMVFQSQTFNGEVGTGPAIPRPLEKALRDGYASNFKYIVMSSWTNKNYLKHEETSLYKSGNFMQRKAPELLNLEIIKGEKDGLREINSIMLSESVANALFGTEDPIGKAIKFRNQFDLMVTSVYKDIPRNTSFYDTHYIIPWEGYVASTEWVKNSEDQWGNNSFQMFVQLADNADMNKVSATIKDVKKNLNEDTAEWNPQLFLFPMKDWYLRYSFENGIQTGGGRIKYVWLFAIIGAFVLLLACINFMNLSTARSEKRAKEVGIRKSIGSQKGQLIYQFLSESFLVVVLAFLVSLLIIVASLNGFNDLAKKEINFPWSSSVFWLISIVFILFTTLLAGSYPALYLSSFKPVDVLKGTFKSGRYAGLPRKVLVVLQFTVSVAFIIGTVIVMQQINYAKNRPVGYDKEGLIQIPTYSQDFAGKTDLMRTEFLNSGAVVEMSASSSPTTQIWSNRSGFKWEGKPEGFQEDLAYTEVSTEYAKSLNLKIVEGRDFSRDFASDSLGVLINESAKKYLGMTNPIGKLLKDDSENNNPPLKIIGVVQDMITSSPYEPVKQGIYVFDRFDNISYYNLRLNPKQSNSKNLATVEKVFKAHFPDIPFQYDFVDAKYGEKFASEERIGTLSGVFTALAILISCLGLFGLTSFVAEQRTKEIGVRKVLGATIFNVWNMLSKDFLKLVIISCFIAIPIAYYIMNGWLQAYPYRVILEWWIFVLAIIGALLVTVITVSFQAIKAAKANPVKSLRTE